MPIKPTLGRVLWFTPHPSAGIQDQQTALIAKVNDDGTLNLMVIAPDGYPYGVRDVKLIQPEEPSPADSAYAEWMPYQLGQATKTEAVEEAARNAGASASTSTVTGSTEDQTATSLSSTEQPHETLIERVEHAVEHPIDSIENLVHGGEKPA